MDTRNSAKHVTWQQAKHNYISAEVPFDDDEAVFILQIEVEMGRKSKRMYLQICHEYEIRIIRNQVYWKFEMLF